MPKVPAMPILEHKRSTQYRRSNMKSGDTRAHNRFSNDGFAPESGFDSKGFPWIYLREKGNSSANAMSNISNAYAYIKYSNACGGKKADQLVGFSGAAKITWQQMHQ